jgi:hypothetical protein
MTWAGVGLSVVSLYFALRGTDLRAIGTTLAGARLWFVLPLVVAQILFYALKAWRWRLMLKPIQLVPTRKLVAPMMIGFMGNNLLPAHLGELIRVFLGAQLLNLAPSQLLASLVLERMFDFTAVLALFAWGAIVLPGVPRGLVAADPCRRRRERCGHDRRGRYPSCGPNRCGWPPGARAPLPEKIRRAILHQLELGAAGMRRAAATGPAARHRDHVAAAVVSDVCLHLRFSLQAMDAVVRRRRAIHRAGGDRLGVMVPAAPGFFGPSSSLRPRAEAVHGRERRAMAAVFYHIIPYLGVTLVGLYFLRQAGLRLREIEHDASQSQEPSATTIPQAVQA